MPYRPEIQPPPQIPLDPALELWLRRTTDTLSTYLVKDRTLGEGVIYDEVDNLTLDWAYIFLNTRGP